MARMALQDRSRLSNLDKARLEQHAPWFGLSLRYEKDGTCMLNCPRGATVQVVGLDAESVHLRLLAELCERTLPWICYAVGDNCADVYLGHSDLRIRRLAELYDQRTESADALP